MHGRVAVVVAVVAVAVAVGRRRGSARSGRRQVLMDSRIHQSFAHKP